MILANSGVKQMGEYRIETDSLGRVRVPAPANYMLDPIHLTKPGNLSK